MKNPIELYTQLLVNTHNWAFKNKEYIKSQLSRIVESFNFIFDMYLIILISALSYFIIFVYLIPISAKILMVMLYIHFIVIYYNFFIQIRKPNLEEIFKKQNVTNKGNIQNN